MGQKQEIGAKTGNREGRKQEIGRGENWKYEGTKRGNRGGGGEKTGPKLCHTQRTEPLWNGGRNLSRKPYKILKNSGV